MTFKPIALALGLAALVAAGHAAATDSCSPSDIATRHHRIDLGGHALGYQTRAGLLPLRDDKTGQISACVFFTAYVRDPAPGRAARPLTFLWNGGPGASSTLVHLEAFGPRRLISGGDPTQPEPSLLAMEDNPGTLLDQSDLVFVDPVGTGFSRSASADQGRAFYNVLGDTASIAQFVGVYRDRFGAKAQPLFLAGESYGVWRAAGVADALEKNGDKVAGVILISGGIPVGPVLKPEIKTALLTPNRTAAAFYFGKLPADLQGNFGGAVAASQKWAETIYAPALLRGDALAPAERETIALQLARFTGLDPKDIDRATLVAPRHLIATRLAASQGKTLGTLDVRVTSPEHDSAARVALIERYFREDLGFEDDQPYLGLGDEHRSPAEAQWAYNQADAPGAVIVTAPDKAQHPVAAAAWAIAMDGPPGGSQPWLTRAIEADPGLKVFIAAGWYDSYNSCVGNAYLVAHLPPALGRNMTPVCYRSGHMIYRDKDAGLKLRSDLRRFYDLALGRPGGR